MKTLIRICMGCALLVFAANACGDVVLTTATINSSALDFDGSISETFGDLGTNSVNFFLTGATIPAGPEFSGITSISISFESAPGTTLSADGGGIVPPGIGMTHPGEFGPSVPFMNNNVGENLMVSITSTSTTGEQVLLSGIEFNSWRNFFPFSEATVVGATFAGGQTVLTGNTTTSPDPILDFDNPVSSFNVESTGSDGIKMANIRLSVSPIPEPAGAAIAGLAIFGCGVRRRRDQAHCG
ncbi:MAG: hypothetical protein AAF456_08820 [Planctomycetota bacterium]